MSQELATLDQPSSPLKSIEAGKSQVIFASQMEKDLESNLLVKESEASLGSGLLVSQSPAIGNVDVGIPFSKVCLCSLGILVSL